MTKGKEDKIGGHKRWVAVLVAMLAFFVAVFGVLQLGCVYTEQTWEYWQPDYAKENIEELVQKE